MESPINSSYYCFPATHFLMFSFPFLLHLNSMINHFNLFVSLVRSTALLKPILLFLHLPLCNSMWLEASTLPHMTTYLKWVLNAAVDYILSILFTLLNDCFVSSFLQIPNVSSHPHFQLMTSVPTWLRKLKQSKNFHRLSLPCVPTSIWSMYAIFLLVTLD